MKQEQEQKGIIVFFSYAQADRALRERLATHLSLLKRDGLIEEWSDQQIFAGSPRAQAIDQAIRSAHIILLLISADFLASDACYQIEMQHALERHRTGVARVIPIIVCPCDWERSPFSHLQCLPRNKKPVTSWSNQDEAFADVATDIRRVIEDLPPLKASALRSVHTFPQPADSLVLPSTRAQRQTVVTSSLSRLLKPLLLLQPLRRRWSRRADLLALLVLIGSIACFAVLSSYLSTHLWASNILHANGTAVTAAASPSVVAANSPTITISTPLKTLQALCNTDYQTQWNLFTSDAQKGYWNNDESIYVSGLKDRDTSHGGVVKCTVAKVMQNGPSASGTVTVTFNDRTINPKIFHLTKEGDGVWRIYLIVKQ